MTWNQFKREVMYEKDAILAGGAIGWASSYYLLNIKMVDISFAIGRQGLIDSVMNSSPALMIARYKVYLIFIAMGMVAGYITGRFIVKKKKRR